MQASDRGLVGLGAPALVGGRIQSRAGAQALRSIEASRFASPNHRVNEAAP